MLRVSRDSFSLCLFVLLLVNCKIYKRLDELSQKIILLRTRSAQMDDTSLGFSVKNGAIEIAQGALGTSSYDYLGKIKKDARRGWIVFYGEGKYWERRAGKGSAAKQKGIISLADFDITKEARNLDQSARPRRKTKR